VVADPPAHAARCGGAAGVDVGPTAELGAARAGDGSDPERRARAGGQRDGFRHDVAPRDTEADDEGGRQGAVRDLIRAAGDDGEREPAHALTRNARRTSGIDIRVPPWPAATRRE